MLRYHVCSCWVTPGPSRCWTSASLTVLRSASLCSRIPEAYSFQSKYLQAIHLPDRHCPTCKAGQGSFKNLKLFDDHVATCTDDPPDKVPAPKITATQHLAHQALTGKPSGWSHNRDPNNVKAELIFRALYLDYPPLDLTLNLFEHGLEVIVLNKYFIGCSVKSCNEVCSFRTIFEHLNDVHDIQRGDPGVLYLCGYPKCKKVPNKDLAHLCSHIRRCVTWLCWQNS